MRRRFGRFCDCSIWKGQIVSRVIDMEKFVDTHDFFGVQLVLSWQLHHRDFVHKLIVVSVVLDVFKALNDGLAVLPHLLSTRRHVLAQLLFAELDRFAFLPVVDDSNWSLNPLLRDDLNSLFHVDLNRFTLCVCVALLLVYFNRRLGLIAILRLLNSHLGMLQRLFYDSVLRLRRFCAVGLIKLEGNVVCVGEKVIMRQKFLFLQSSTHPK